MKMKNFTIIPNEILEESQLSIPSRYLLCVLLRYCGKDEFCYPSQETLGKTLGYTARYIRILLNELEKAKLIHRKRTGFNKSNTYRVTKDFDRNYSSHNPTIKNRNNNSPQLGSKFPLHQGNSIPPKITYRKEKRKNMDKKGFESLKETLKRNRLI